MKKIIRKHNASTLFDAFLTSFKSTYDGSLIFTWTKVESKAHEFENDTAAQKALDDWMQDRSDNYCYKFSII